MKRFHQCFGPFLMLMLVLVAGNGCTKRMRARRLLTVGNSDFNSERYDDAETDYKSVRHLDPMNPTAIGQLGCIYVKEGRILDARSYLQEAVKLEPNSLPFQLAYAQVEASIRDVTNASKIALRILSAQPTNGEALLLLGETYVPPQGLPQVLESLPGIVDNPSYHTVLGLLSLRERRFTDADNEFRLALAADPKSCETYFGIAQLRAAQKDAKGAAEAFKQSADLAPLHSPIRSRYIDFLIQNGSADEARKMLQETTEKIPDYLPGWIGLMNLDLAQRKYEDASKTADIILARDPYSYEGLTGQGSISLATGDAAKAVLQFEHLDSLYKNIPPIKYNLAAAYLMARNRIKGVAALNQSLALNPYYPQAVLLMAQLDIRGGDAGSAINLLTRFIKKAPGITQPYFLLADAYLAQREPEGALTVYRQLAKDMPKNPQIPLLIGTVLAEERRDKEARGEFEKALELAPEYLPAAEQLVNLDLVEHNYAAATALAQAQIGKDPKASGPWELQAKIDLAQTNRAAAEADLQKAINLNPNSPNPYLLLSQVYAGATNIQKALDNLNALVARTNDPSAYLQIASFHEELKEFDAARDAYEKVLQANSNSVAALNNLAYIYAVRLNDPDRALKLVQRARELVPDSPNIGDTLGWTYYEKGDYTPAAAVLEESAERSPTDAEIQFHLGMAYYMLDAEDAARVALQRAVTSPQDFPNKDEARSRLALLNGATTMADLEKTLKERPNDPVVLTRIGQLQERAGDVEKAVDTYETALKQDPDSAPIMIRLAQLYASPKMNELDKAMSLAMDAHRLAPDNAEAAAFLGRLIYLSGTDYERALSLLEGAADRLSGRPEYLYNLAWAYYSVGRIGDAQTTMQKALQTGGASALFPIDDAKRFLTLADALNSQAAAQAAAVQARQVLQANAKYVPALMISGLADECAGNFADAHDAYGKALEIFPRFVPAARQLAILDAEHFGDDATGYDMAEKARTAYPNDPAVAKSLGILSYYQAKYSRSVELLRECLSQNGNDGEVHYYLGMDYNQLKQGKESKQSLQQALSLGLPEKLAAQARRTLAGS